MKIFLLIDIHTFCRLKPSKTKGWLVQFLGKSLSQKKKGAWLNRNWWRSRWGRIAIGGKEFVVTSFGSDIPGIYAVEV